MPINVVCYKGSLREGNPICLSKLLTVDPLFFSYHPTISHSIFFCQIHAEFLPVAFREGRGEIIFDIMTH